MKRLECRDVDEFVENAIRVFKKLIDMENDGGGYQDITIVAKHDETCEIVERLIRDYGFKIRSLEIMDDLYGDYTDEYLIEFVNICGTYELICEPFKRNDTYFECLSTVTYVLDDCSSACLHKINSDRVIEVCIEESDEEGCDFDECRENCSDESCDCDFDSEYISVDDDSFTLSNVSRDDDGNPTSIHKHWYNIKDGASNYSSYTCITDDVERLKEIAKLLDIEL